VTHPLPLLWQAPAPVQWLSLVNATVCTVLPVLAIMLAVQRVGSSLAAQVGMLGPVSTIVMSLWLLDEPMGPAQIAGTVLVLIGVLLVTACGADAGAGACAHPGGDPRDPGGAGDGLRPGGDAPACPGVHA
jgi:EamA domain-containing membrane protein RarD